MITYNNLDTFTYNNLDTFLDVLNDILTFLIRYPLSVHFKITIKENTIYFTFWHFLLAFMVISLLAKLIYNDWGSDD